MNTLSPGARITAFVLKLRFVIGGVILTLVLLASLAYSYPLFHTLVELITIGMGMSLFVLAWNTFKWMNNKFIFTVCLVFGAVGALDLLHTLSYKGINVLPTNDSNTATQFWIAARWLQSLTILMAALLLPKTSQADTIIQLDGAAANRRFAYRSTGWITTAVVVLMVLILTGKFPVCYIEGQGLTRFKIISEYLISVVLIASLLIVRHKKFVTDRKVSRLLTGAIGAAIIAELTFTLYVDVYDLSNAIGHLVRLAAYIMVYTAIIQEGMKNTYGSLFDSLVTQREHLENLEKQLKTAMENLRLIYDNSRDVIWVLDIESQKFIYVSPSVMRLRGYTPEEVMAQSMEEALTPESQVVVAQSIAESLKEFLETGSSRNDVYEIHQPHKNGTIVPTEVTTTYVRTSDGRLQVIGITRDITERNKSTDLLKKTQERLEFAQTIAKMGSWEKDLLTGTSAWSKEMFRLMGFDPALGVPRFEEFLKHIHPDDLPGYLEKERQILECGISDSYIARICFENCLDRTYEFTLQPVKNAAGELIQMAGTVMDITEKQQANESLRLANERFEQLANHIEEVFWIYDLENQFMAYISPAYERIWGRTCQSLYDNPRQYIESILPEDQPMMFSALTEQSQGKPTIMEYRIVQPGGAVRWILDRSFPVHDEAGRLVRTAGIAMDFTFNKLARVDMAASEEKYRQLSQQLEQRVIERTAELSAANDALARASRLKDEFMASMSHELRTPLTGILGLSEVLQMGVYGPNSEKQVKALQTIEESGRHLLELINDILDLSKIEADMLELNIEPVIVSDVCQASLQLTQGMAQKKKLKVSHNSNLNPIVVNADARRLKQMVVNLLSNAIKFTPAGGSIGVEVNADAIHQTLSICVWDTGIGIEPQDIGRLFQPFIQLDSSLSRQYSGTGLGLAMVSRLARLHNGSVSVKSEPGRGSRFILSLPWKPDALNFSNGPEHAAPALFNASEQIQNNLTILLVDDNTIILETVGTYLESIGYTLERASSGEEMVEKAARLQPDLVIADVQMPGMDGLEAIRLVSSSNQTALPIIAMTALAMPGDEQRCLEAGATIYLAKPVRLDNLRATIESLLKTSG